MGVFAFWAILLVFTTLSQLWLRGKIGSLPSHQTTLPTGKVVRFDVFGKKFSLRMGKEFWVRVAFLALGAVAILSLSVSYANFLPLRETFTIFVLPAYLFMLVLGILFPKFGRRAALGFTGGVIATMVYDIVRLAITFALGLTDPIPHIGILLLGENVAGSGAFWWLGYLWRLFGNGAGIAIVYSMLPRWFHNVKGGLIFGTCVSLGMLAILFFFPAAQLQLFALNGLTVVNGFLGHWAYGGTLGWIFSKTKQREELTSPVQDSERPLTWTKDGV